MVRKREENPKTQKASPGAAGVPGMSRELKRMLSKRERAADRSVRPPVAKRKRTKPREFIKEVRGELSRVAWPNRREIVTYTIVVLVSVAFFMTVITIMDFLSSRAVFELISRGGGQ